MKWTADKKCVHLKTAIWDVTPYSLVVKCYRHFSWLLVNVYQSNGAPLQKTVFITAAVVRSTHFTYCASVQFERVSESPCTPSWTWNGGNRTSYIDFKFLHSFRTWPSCDDALMLLISQWRSKDLRNKGDSVLSSESLTWLSFWQWRFLTAVISRTETEANMSM
jgi:hypothetical protein